jgi:hypothetical protein
MHWWTTRRNAKRKEETDQLETVLSKLILRNGGRSLDVFFCLERESILGVSLRKLDGAQEKHRPEE